MTTLRKRAIGLLETVAIAILLATAVLVLAAPAHDNARQGAYVGEQGAYRE